MAAADPFTPALPSEVSDLLARLPKVELHLHLDGSVRPATALELARDRLPEAVMGLNLEAIRDRLVAPMPCRNQAELLAAFDLPIAILQDADALGRVSAELVADLAADGIAYAEIRWAPSLHTVRGMTLRSVIRAVVDGISAGRETVARDGQVIEVRLITTAMRSQAPEEAEALARAAGAFLGEGVVGFDLAGPEEAFPNVRPFGRAFEVARSAGLGITVHAGEWGGAPQVRRALELDPARIAHGAPAADDPALLDELRARDVVLDLCPTSNWQAGLVRRLPDHPLPHLLRAGVPVTLSTDDRTVSAISLSEEYGRGHALLGLSLPELGALDRRAVKAAFLETAPALRARLDTRIASFLSVEPTFSA
ncbi:MAG TPA: adenosine deaminase [Candidatus Limnocylindrales bacterium]|nr:adenosine deaminase [Candidatus Limnocylindrales bacterium]